MGLNRGWRLLAAALVSSTLAGLAGGCAARIARAPTAMVPQPTASLTAVPPTKTPLPTKTSPPTATPAPTETPAPTYTPHLAEVRPVTLTIVYDNNAYDPNLRTAWGFACLVETEDANVLFDTGGDGPTLLGNMDALGIDPHDIDAIVRSHIHGDHTGGLLALLDRGITPTVFTPAAFPQEFKDAVRARTDLVEVTGPAELLPGIWATGELGSNIIEEALAVESDAGLIVITGCAHPGVVELVRQAKAVLGQSVVLVTGGFHLGSASQIRIAGIVDAFRELGVQRVAPCHCTGDRAHR
ncbi:MAG: MBL fold metallo-hydrolase, partial [Anaerolineae bacterium]|nr:MBL fold metallo-hydrolase [Anaerolineae bacterium]